MNQKHAKALRQGISYYITDVIIDTPEGVTPAEPEELRKAGNALAGVIRAHWPRLSHKQRGYFGMRLYDLKDCVQKLGALRV